MKVIFKCCPKPVLNVNKNAMPLFKGEAPTVTVNTAPAKDTVEITSKPKAEDKKPADCVDCK